MESILRHQIDLTLTRFAMERRRYGHFSKKLSQVGFLCFFEGLHLENVPIFWVVFRVFSARSGCYDQNFLMSVKNEFLRQETYSSFSEKMRSFGEKRKKQPKKRLTSHIRTFLGVFF